MAKNVLEVMDLKKTFKSGFIPKPIPVLNGVSFKIPRGSVTGFLGANGAGKTTSIKCVLELIFADSGEILFFDGEPLSSAVKRKIGFLPERPYFYSYLTGREFLSFYGELSGTFKSRSDLKVRVVELLNRVGLSQAGDRLLKDYSKGMLQRVGIAQALIHHPEFVIFDEPQSGLDPDGRLEVSKIIQETAKEGTSVFFSSHLLPDAEKLCDRVVMMKQGKIIYEGPLKDLLHDTNHGSTITYFKGGDMVVKSVKDNKSLQTEIAAILKEHGEIREIRREHMSLEEAYSRLTKTL